MTTIGGGKNKMTTPNLEKNVLMSMGLGLILSVGSKLIPDNIHCYTSELASALHEFGTWIIGLSSGYYLGAKRYSTKVNTTQETNREQ